MTGLWKSHSLWIPWGLHAPLSKMAWSLFTHIVPAAFRGSNGLVVIHVIRFQWSDNNLPNATSYIRKGKLINLSCQPQHQHSYMLPGTSEAWKSLGLFLILLPLKWKQVFMEKILGYSLVHSYHTRASVWDSAREAYTWNQSRDSLL